MFGTLIQLSLAFAAPSRPAPVPYDPEEVVRSRTTRTLHVGDSGALALRQDLASGGLSLLAVDRSGTVSLVCLEYDGAMWDWYLAFFGELEGARGSLPNAVFAPADVEFRTRLERTASPAGVSGVRWCDLSAVTFRGDAYVDVTEVEACFSGKGCLESYAFVHLRADDLALLVGALTVYREKRVIPSNDDAALAEELMAPLQALSESWRQRAVTDVAALAFYISRGHGAQDSLQHAMNCVSDDASTTFTACYLQ